jgi:uncharacterized RDD family membrane protein YckC
MDGDEPVYIYGLPDDEVKQVKPGLFRRAGAYIIDLAIFYFIFFQIFFMIYSSMAGIPVGGTPQAYTTFILNNSAVYMKLITGVFASGFIFLCYLVVSEKYLGATPGGRMLGLKVISLDKTEMTFTRLINRNLLKSVLILFIILDSIPVFFTKNKQRYSEIVSGTKTVYGGKLELVYEGYV